MVTSTGFKRPFREFSDAGARALHLDAGFAQLVQHGVHVIGARAVEGHFAIGRRRRHGEGRRFDAVGNDFVLRAVQALDAGDGDGRAAGAGNPAPMALRKLARSTTSGSQAALSIMVTPSARTAAIMTLPVPSTVGPERPPRNTSAPRKRRAVTWT